MDKIKPLTCQYDESGVRWTSYDLVWFRAYVRDNPDTVFAVVNDKNEVVGMIPTEPFLKFL